MSQLRYYASKISPNMARTPEGYLLCQNVPIARTGQQEYLASELPMPTDTPNKKVIVYRRAEDVFAPAAIASFQGKTVTSEHPEDPVNPDNVRQHIKGVVTNVRRGSGREADMLIADLVIYDAQLICEIENGKREVSCGYDCTFAVEGGRIYQKNIVGNHVAVVSVGRAGHTVSIKDESPVIKGGTPPKKGRSSRMKGNKKRPSERGLVPTIARIVGLVKDSDPDEVTEAIEDLVEAIEEDVTEAKIEVIKADDSSKCADKTKDEAKKDEAPATDSKTYELLEKVYEKLEKLDGEVKEIRETSYKKLDPLEKLEAELSGDGDPGGESEHVEDPDDINDDSMADEALDTEVEDDEAPVMPAEGRPVNPLTKDAALKELRKMKPIIAAISDPKQRKTMSDSVAAMIRASHRLPASGGRSSGNGYAGIVSAKKQHAAKHKAADSKAKGTPPQDIEDLGDKIAAARLGKQ